MGCDQVVDPCDGEGKLAVAFERLMGKGKRTRKKGIR